MYRLSRLLLIVTVFGWLYSAILALSLLRPGWALTTVVVFGALMLPRGLRRLTTLGSARWADEDDLRRAGMLHVRTGLILGRIAARHSVVAAARNLFRRRLGAREACLAFWMNFQRGQKPLVRLPQAVHTAVFSPTGGGKGQGILLPWLAECDENAVVVDPKGENAKLTAERRRKRFGHKIILLDPFQIATKSPDRFNPLDFINENSPTALDECTALANALVIRTGEEKEPHWNDSAESWIGAFLATVVRYGGRDDGNRSLQTVRELLSNPQRLAMGIQLMCESDCWGGMLARMGNQLSHYVDRERSSTLTTVARHMRFLDTVAVAESTKASSFNPADLLSGKMTVYLILPPEHMRDKSALLRMWIGAMLRAVVRSGLQERRKVHFLLDEAASLGHMEAIDDAVDKYRGYGVRLTFMYQSIAQLKKCFPNGQDQTLLSNVSQVFFGVNEPATAEYVSSRLGEETIVLESGGTSRGSTRQYTDSAQPSNSASWSDNASSNWQQQARKLLKPEEVIALPPRTAITFTPGVPPVATTLLRFYEERRLGQGLGRLGRSLAALNMLLKAASFCAASLVLAYIMTLVVEQAASAPPVHQSVEFLSVP